ncbi:DoxX family protein [Marixanthomonas sp. SCSIO 43207]|uniref:BT_3928 family protein n=1 Tax=Marixanthomonas sp. SCSIO 43207 TaxID=2779360 RepID=UPI001CA8FC10|nr:BT_3928 family protein [Marixanthomonas sp. SCSIO 43207]UAB81336.1 DoxX family protein [Marixanthomonas sp. SCSIO 43207]
MKILVGISRIVVGILFIFSGLIKLNDPIGFSFKLQDYFAPGVLDLEFLIPYSLLIAIFIVIFEVLLGVMLLVGYLRKFTVWSLLLMIVFFTFLTFYSAYFNKVTDCGCFGDAIKLTPWESFTKDVILLVFILILFIWSKHITPFFTRNIRSLIIFIGFIACLGITYHVLMHLPIIDFRPYKIGANIQEGMSIPNDAQKPVYQYDWKFKVDGEEKIVTTKGDYPTQKGEFLGVETTEIQAGYVPPIHDFTIERDGQNYVDKFLNEENLIVVVAYNLTKSEKDGFFPVSDITNEALKKGYKVIGLSASSKERTQTLADRYKLNFDFYFCDETTLKTIVRSNPGVLHLQNGTIKQKVHWNDINTLKLQELDGAIPQLDFNLKKRLDSIGVLDQRYRKLMQAKDAETRATLGEEMGLTPEEYNGDLWAMQTVLDSSNMLFVEKVFKNMGYPGKTTVGEPTNTVAWYVVQHNPDKIPEYLPLIKEAGKNKEIPFRLVAMMEDRYLMNQGKPQIYGTQGRTYDDERGNLIWPIENPETVNERRKEAGFDQTIEEYAKVLFGDDFEYKALTIEAVKE